MSRSTGKEDVELLEGGEGSDSEDDVVEVEGPNEKKRKHDPNAKKIPKVKRHFDVVIDKENDSISYSCNYCPEKWTFKYQKWKEGGSSSSNQTNHVKSSHPEKYYDKDKEKVSGPMDVYLQTLQMKDTMPSVTVTAELIRTSLEDLIIAESLPFTLLESPFFRRLLSLLAICEKKDINFPRADAIRDSITVRVKSMKSDLRKQIHEEISSKVHVILDCWTSPNYQSFLAITIQYLDENWNLKEHLLDFVNVFDHSGDNLSAFVIKCLEFFKLKDEIGCFVMDNATNNDTLLNNIEKWIGNPKWKKKANRLRCLPHIINLACNAFLDTYNAFPSRPAPKGGESPDPPDLMNKNLNWEADAELYDSNEIVNEQEEKKMEEEKSIGDPSLLIRRVRYVIKKLRSSVKERESFLFHCQATKAPQLIPILDVRTRWNSTYEMLYRIVVLRKAFNSWISSNPVIGKVKLGQFFLTDSDWVDLERIIAHLSVFADASKLLSGNSYTTLSLVMPVYIETFKYIESEVKRDDLSEKEQIALTNAHQVLSKYYAFTDDCPVYIASLLLDPRFKSQYLVENGFESDYPGLIEESVGYLEQCVDKKKRESLSKAKATSFSLVSSSDASSSVSSSDVINQDGNKVVARMFAFRRNQPEDIAEVNNYLSFPLESEQVDPLIWWEMHAKDFPFLSKVAKDILSAPGSSVCVERLFNCGRDVIGIRRHSLKAETTSCLMFGRIALKKNKK
jgi:hypothetical protein